MRYSRQCIFQIGIAIAIFAVGVMVGANTAPQAGPGATHPGTFATGELETDDFDLVFETWKFVRDKYINEEKIDLEKLTIKSIEIFEGKSLKRFHPSTRGRVHPYKKRSSHIKIVLTDDKSQISNLKSQSKKGQNGTKS